MEKLYQKNLKSLIAQNPKMGEELSKITTNSNFDVFFDENRLNALDLRTNTHIYNDDDYKKIADEFLLEHSRKKVIFAYGFGLGVFYKLLFEKGDFNHIIVFEPDLELVYIAFHLADFTKELDSDRLFFMEPFNYDESKLSTLCSFATIKPYLLTYFLYMHSDYYGKFNENILQISKNLSLQMKTLLNLHGNCPNDSLVGIKNTILNIDDIIKNIQITKFGKANFGKNKSVVIASTGPSLAKQLPLLKEYQDRVFIFCPDASYPILMREGIVPDAIFSIERVIETSKFYENAYKNTEDKNSVFIMADLVHPQTIKNLEGKNKILALKGLEFEFNLNLNEYGYVSGGQSSAFLAAEIATMLDFDNICLIGQDLAYGKDGTTHSKGHTYSENEWDIDKYGYMTTTAYGGVGEVKTVYTWIAFKEHFEIYFGKHKDKNYFNATEGGARINQAKEISFKEFLQTYAKDKKTNFILEQTTKKEQKDAFKRYQKSIQNQYDKILFYIDKLDGVSLHITKLNEKLKKYEKNIKIDSFMDEINQFIQTSKADTIDINRFYDGFVDDELLKELEKASFDFFDILKSSEFKKYFAGLCVQRIYNCELKINQILSYPRNSKEQIQNNILLLNEHIKYYSMEFCGYARVLYEVLFNEIERLKKDIKC